MRTNQIPRQIPEQNFYTQPIPGVIMGGVLPFGCIFIQLFFILNSLWYVSSRHIVIDKHSMNCVIFFLIRSSQVYYMFGFLFLVFLILVITCSETTILLCYFHLCAEVSIHIEYEIMKTSLNENYNVKILCRIITGGGAVFSRRALPLPIC